MIGVPGRPALNYRQRPARVAPSGTSAQESNDDRPAASVDHLLERLARSAIRIAPEQPRQAAPAVGVLADESDSEESITSGLVLRPTDHIEDVCLCNVVRVHGATRRWTGEEVDAIPEVAVLPAAVTLIDWLNQHEPTLSAAPSRHVEQAAARKHETMFLRGKAPS